MKKYFLLVYFITAPLLCMPPLKITNKQAQEIGMKIWHNECNGKVEGLASWNDGEEFPSLGIGHFIWYPKGKNGVFKESFPTLLTYMKQHKKKMPRWLASAQGAPWSTKEQFHAAHDSKKMKELRTFLTDTIDLQTAFIIERLIKLIEKVDTTFSPTQASQLKKQFYRVAENPNGLYALIDYINFKGEGFDETESYNKQGWGLIQVLKQMQKIAPGQTALQEFADSAKKVLTQRVQNAPKQRNEERWLKGWFNRIGTYTQV